MAGNSLTAYRFEPGKRRLSARIAFGRQISHSLAKNGKAYGEKAEGGETT